MVMGLAAFIGTHSPITYSHHPSVTTNTIISKPTSETCDAGEYTNSDGVCTECSEGVRTKDMNQLHGCQACKDTDTPCPGSTGTECVALEAGQVCVGYWALATFKSKFNGLRPKHD